MTVLVTGAAGFIGFHTCRALLDRGDDVVGIDDVNDYYDVALKMARLAVLGERNRFRFERMDIAERADMEKLTDQYPHIDRIVHLAAQAGVRYSLINPYAYLRTNVDGQLMVLEAGRRLEGMKHLVFASSSSVYGGNTEMPFTADCRVDTPLSLYAATKRSAELMAHTYAHLYRLPLTGLRFFTVYGPWGRPDMAAFIFTRKILAGEPIPVFNNGDMRRDFTYIDDIVSGIVACLDHPPADGEGTTPFRLYNIGNSRTESLMRFIGLIETALGRKAEIQFLPMQPGDVKETFSDISPMQRDFGYSPATTIDDGIPRFVDWYRDYHRA